VTITQTLHKIVYCTSIFENSDVELINNLLKCPGKCFSFFLSFLGYFLSERKKIPRKKERMKNICLNY